MNPIAANISALVGIALVGAGTAMISVPGALIVVGALVIAMTLVGVLLGRKG